MAVPVLLRPVSLKRADGWIAEDLGLDRGVVKRQREILRDEAQVRETRTWIWPGKKREGQGRERLLLLADPIHRAAESLSSRKTGFRCVRFLETLRHRKSRGLTAPAL